MSSGLFKQIPGINLTWHDITLSMPAGVDYALAKKKLYTAAVDSLADYREEIQRQTRELPRTTSSNTGGDALPTLQLSYSVKGVDAHVRYPVHLPHAAEIDERIVEIAAAGQFRVRARRDRSGCTVAPVRIGVAVSRRCYPSRALSRWPRGAGLADPS